MIAIVQIKFLILLIILINLVQSKFSSVPPPPKRPERFHSREELKQYLQKLHEYHTIVGRWRLRRDTDDDVSLKSSTADLFHFFDINHDHVITNAEFAQQLKVQKQLEQMSITPNSKYRKVL